MIVAHNDPSVNIENIIPYAEGHYNALEIPIILVSNRDGNNLLSFFTRKQTEVILSISVDMEGDKTEIVQTEFWLNPGNPDSYAFFPRLEHIMNKFGDKVEFQPKYKFQNLQNKDYSKDFKKKHCVSAGRFCQIENPEVNPLSVFKEAIIQICLWKTTNSPNISDPEIKSEYWKYVGYFSQCLKSYKYDHHGELDCSERGFEIGGVTQGIVENVKKCIGDPDKHDEEKDLMLIDNENSYEYSDIYLVPAFFINGELLKEEINERSIVVAICDKLIDKPPYCDQYFIGKKGGNTNMKDSMTGLLVFAIVGTFVLIFIILCLMRSKMNNGIDKEIYAEVNTYVSNYMKMKE